MAHVDAQNEEAQVALEVVLADGPQYDTFEGPEKLLEVWFGPMDDEQIDGTTKSGLRTVARAVWDEMLSLVKCQVLNVISNEHFDAYLLSESSMFVWNGRLILKTCGTTTLLKAVPMLVKVANGVGLDLITQLFYSRKRFLFPEKQIVPHGSFSHEVQYLDELFDNGSAYVMGKLNDEHWYLYMTAPSITRKTSTPLPSDKTLEVLMGDLHPSAVKPFFKTSGFSAKEASKAAGIAEIFPDAIIDDFAFDPCGYSCNAIIGKHYFTIHVTPQESCSFASFETNVVLGDYNELLRKVAAIFKPGTLSATLFSNEPVDSMFHSTNQFDLEGYTKTEKIFYQFPIYNLLFVAQKETTRSLRKSSTACAEVPVVAQSPRPSTSVTSALLASSS
eukprot:TRINITY_DN1185_c0_g1_i2.p1 TRINITY_DN1185_c0_g1~~TRINITY_DN1185_c0_g1_i2.p1  ORF type:complete len:389 (+),score=69.13 TRINITY_DN1185_c0_g1_i2:434-1600(+)